MNTHKTIVISFINCIYNMDTLLNWFNRYKESSLSGRHIHLEHILPLLTNLSKKLTVGQLGNSENDEPIHLITLGSGSKKLLFWSQMHGNESTTTKAVFDLINVLLDSSNEFSEQILSTCTLYIVPILSPDGAKAYTRFNYNKVDLNRDAQNRTQRESIILYELIQRVQPDVAFNLHGQRTIFSAGETNHSAIVSFLSPAGDLERTLIPCRKVAMEIIAHMNIVLQEYIPDCVGRYDDGFNINCVGDTLTSLGIPTILFEAGHYPMDYDREKTREYIFYALISGIGFVAAREAVSGEGYKSYFAIPENAKCFYDIIIRDVILSDRNVDIAIQYVEELSEKSIKFIPKIEKIANLENFYGHREIIGNKREIWCENVTVEVMEGEELLKFCLNDEVFSTELIKS